MKAIETRARKHFKNVKAGEFKPTYSTDFAAADSAMVWVGNVPLPLEDYYNCLAARDRVEARKLIKAPPSLCPPVPTQKKKDSPTTTEDLEPASARTSEDARNAAQIEFVLTALGVGENATDPD